MPLPFNEHLEGDAVERFTREGDDIVRTVVRRDGNFVESRIHAARLKWSSEEDLASQHDLAWLTANQAPEVMEFPGSPEVRVVDLFAGCGGLSLGVAESCRAVGKAFVPVLAVDTDQRALGVYEANFPEVEALAEPVESFLDGEIGSALTFSERALRKRMGDIDLLIGGPPCQGHSDLNNHTRRRDPRNELYLRMARFCEVVRPSNVIIENVPGVLRDHAQAAQRTWTFLESLGYQVSTGTINSADVGVAQSRKRNLTLASLQVQPSVHLAVADVGRPTRPVDWAINDLRTHYDPSSIFDSAPVPTGETLHRISYLFTEGLYDLPDSERPDCHRLKSHTYKSNYGRMYPDRPAQTITTGFGVMGKGRFVHPHEPRTITPHEAARVQFFPDFFDFGSDGRIQLQKLIGNAVPPKLGYAVGLHLLR